MNGHNHNVEQRKHIHPRNAGAMPARTIHPCVDHGCTDAVAVSFVLLRMTQALSVPSNCNSDVDPLMHACACADARHLVKAVETRE